MMAGGLARSRDVAATATRELLRDLPSRDQIDIKAGARLLVLVLSCTVEDTIGVDLASTTMVRLRVPWHDGALPDLAAFDVVEATLAEDPERDDTAQPEAVTLDELPRLVGSLRGGVVRRRLKRLQAPQDGPLFGFRGPSAPYWELRGDRPSVALIVPQRGPQLLRRRDDGTTWVRFGWERDDVWLALEDRHAIRALDAARRDRMSGKELAVALGFKPRYLLTALSRPVDGHCYKLCVGILPRG
jgi:hypothetical protein